MRYLGLDLGTKTLGVAISDKTGKLATPYKTLHFDFEKYDEAIKGLKEIIDEYKITKVALGLPKNMDGTLGFAAQRSLLFKEKLENELNLEVELIDERLTSIEAHNILSDNGKKMISHKKIVDSVAATLILETFLKKEGK